MRAKDDVTDDGQNIQRANEKNAGQSHVSGRHGVESYHARRLAFIYSRDLPDISHLAQFAPSAESQVSDICLDMPSVAIPFDQIGETLRAEYEVLVAATA